MQHQTSLLLIIFAGAIRRHGSIPEAALVANANFRPLRRNEFFAAAFALLSSLAGWIALSYAFSDGDIGNVRETAKREIREAVPLLALTVLW